MVIEPPQANDVAPYLLRRHTEYVRDKLSGNQLAHNFRIEAVGVPCRVVRGNPSDGGPVACSFHVESPSVADNLRPVALVLARKQQFGAVPLNAHAHGAVGRANASVASGLVRRAEIFGHVLDDNGLGLWACPDATLASPHAALAAHRARLDRSGTVLVVRVVGVAALAVVDRLREAV